MSDIHRTAASGFDAAADTYERARPGYPSGAVDYLVEALALPPDGLVLDLAAGTGKLTRDLVARGLRCVAVEPVEGMRARFAAVLPGVEVLDGTAEAIPLGDESVDAVTVAQAFHWFRHEEALAEIGRVLRARGRLALVWNVRDERVAWVRRVTEIIDPHEGAGGVRIPRYRERAWLPALERTRLFRHLDAREFEHAQPMTPEGLVERVASTSFIAVLPDATRERVGDEVRALTEEHPDLRGRVGFDLPYVTEVLPFERT